ncbi:MAG: phosphoglycerate kinase [Patescibacteria group bacterium]
MKINSVRNLRDFKGKIIFLRVDFNVPISGGKVREDHKIKAGLETIDYLLSKGARLIIATHLGNPKKPDCKLSTRPIAARLKTLLRRPVKFSPKIVGAETKVLIKKIKPGEALLLENLRFYQGEYTNDSIFAKELASLADIYVNDAFAVCHRAQASVVAICKYLPSYAGLLLEKEISALSKIIRPKKPLVVIMGGAKVKTKAPLISKLYPKADKILLGGALANNFFKFQKLEVGKSLVDSDSDAVIKKFFKNKKIASKIILPIDVVVKTKTGKTKLVLSGNVQKSEKILDVGPETIAVYAEHIKKAQTIVWNGPMGKFEEDSFKHGTLSIARLVASRSSGPAHGVIGGGETVEAFQLTKMSEYMDWISTAGGAMLSYLGGDKMPGIKKLIK